MSVSAPERRRFNIILHDQNISIAKELEPLKVDYTFPIADISACLCLRIPEKAKPQYNLVFFSRTHTSSEPVLQVTLPDEKAETLLRDPTPYSNYKEYKCKDFFTEVLQKHFNVKVECAEDSSVAYRGNKEGYLFLLDRSIFFGFKKPILLFHHEVIESVSYSHITQRTFNLTIKLSSPLTGSPALEYEFAMIDQEDYDEINNYMNSKQFGNASLDESRRAKATTNEYSNELQKAVEEQPEVVAAEPEASFPGNPGATIADVGNGGGGGGNDDDDDEEEDEDYTGGPAGSGSESESGSEEEEDSDEMEVEDE